MSQKFFNKLNITLRHQFQLTMYLVPNPLNDVLLFMPNFGLMQWPEIHSSSPEVSKPTQLLTKKDPATKNSTKQNRYGGESSEWNGHLEMYKQKSEP